MQKQALLLSAGATAGAVSIAWAAYTDRIYVVPAILTILFLCARWSMARQRHPMPDAWFEPRKH